MNPMIYNKSSIYKGAGIYKTGAEGGGGGGETAKIDGKDYTIKKIGNLYWTCENIKVDTDNAKIKNGEYFYRLNTLSEITAKLSDGWRVPSRSDFQDLLNTFTRSNDNVFWPWGGYILKSNDWTNLQGALQGFDAIGFSAKQTGYYQEDAPSSVYDAVFATTTGEYKMRFSVDTNGAYISNSDYVSADNYFTIRLCKPE